MGNLVIAEQEEREAGEITNKGESFSLSGNYSLCLTLEDEEEKVAALMDIENAAMKV